MDTIEQKRQAVLTVAKAFYDRGKYVQYDQRSMDRVLQLTPRRRKRLPPESANGQQIQFLDCSGYVSAIYLTAFGYELPSDLTWLMIDQMENRIFYYELTHRETDGDIYAMEEKLRALLQPGDLITVERNGNGHVVMYLGDNQYTDCTVPEGQKNSYNYEECKNQIYEQGLWIRSLDMMLPVEQEKLREGRSMFKETIKRFSVHRPVEIVGDILPQTKIRMEQAKDLWCAVENSAPGCRQAYPGGKVEYTVIVRNQGKAEKEVTVSFAAPAGAVFSGEGTVNRVLQGGEEVCLPFTVTVEMSNGEIKLDGPRVTVNGLEVYAHPVLLGRAMTDDQWKSVKETALTELQSGATAIAAAAKAYGSLGISLDPVQKHYSWTYFCFHDATAGDVLSRQPQKPFEDLAVYSGFGGKCVITPEMTAVNGVRTTHILPRDLLPGDVVLCLEDGFGDVAYSAFYDGERLVGCFGPDGRTRAIHGEELERFIDSLFGRFAFLLIRPSQGLGNG